MKYLLLLVIVISSMLMLEFGHSVRAAGASSIQVIIDDVEIPLTVKPIEVKGNVMLHAKSIFDTLKISSTFDKKRITINYAGTTFKAEVNQSRYYRGNQDLRMAQPPLVLEGRIYIPMGFISTVLEKDVNYDSASRQLVFGLTGETKKVLQRNLFQAARKGDAVAIVNLMKRGADPNGKMIDEWGDNTPLDYAVSNNKTEASIALIKGGARVGNNASYLGFRAILYQNAEVLDALLTAGLDPNTKGNTGTLLESASGIIGISEGETHREVLPSQAIVDTLLKHGADPSRDNSLYQAFGVQNYNIIQSLLRNGADPYKKNEFGNTPYELSVQKNINRWVVIQDKRAIVPSLRITNAEGRLMKEGNLFLISSDNPREPINYTSWASGQVYVDIPNGKYQILHVLTEDNTYIFSQNDSIVIQGETVMPSTLKLPELNVSGTLTSSAIAVDGGCIMLLNPRTSDIVVVIVNGNKFNLYAPPGQYRVIEYRDANNNFYYVRSDLTVTATSGKQDITVDIKQVANTGT